MVKLLPLAVLRLIFNQCDVTITSLFCRWGRLDQAWSQLQRLDSCSHTRTSHHIEWLVAPVRTHGQPSTQFRLGHVPTSVYVSHSGAGEMTGPESSGPAWSAAPEGRSTDLKTARSGQWMPRLARLRCRVAGYALLRNTLPGGLVRRGRSPLSQSGLVFPPASGDDTSVRSQWIQCLAQRPPPGRFDLSDGSCCNYTSLHHSSCWDQGVHDVAMHMQSTACTGSCVHSVGQWCEYRWMHVPLWSLWWSSADSCCNHVSPQSSRFFWVTPALVVCQWMICNNWSQSKGVGLSVQSDPPSSGQG